MASSSASEVFSSPEAFVASNPTAARVLDPLDISGLQGKAAAEADRKRAEAAAEAAKTAKTQVDTTGTSTQNTTGTTNQTSTKSFAPKSAEEQALLDASISNFGKQGALVDSAEADIANRLGTQGQARDALGNVLSGDAFNLTGSEQARIEALRGADISASSNAVNELLDQRLAQTSADAQRRGLRGQAFTQLQGDATRTAAQELNRATLDANRNAAQNAITLPGQRVGIQAGSAGQFADFADAAKQQAIKNRQDLQDPVAMKALLDERLAGGTTTTAGTTNQTTTGTESGTRVGTGEGAAEAAAVAAGTMDPNAAAIASTREGVGTGAKIIASVV